MDKQTEKDTGNKKKRTKIYVILISIALVIVLAVMLWLAFLDAEYLEFDTMLFLDSPASRDNMYDMVTLEKKLDDASPLMWIFFSYGDELEERRAQYDALVKAEADKISKGIDALPTYTKIESQQQYEQIALSICELQLDTTDVFEEAVCKEVSNYDQLEQYILEIEALRAVYKHDCDKCKTEGYVSCTFCHGKGKETCSSCRGSGKQSQTWYSHGDWGDKSYTSSSCGSCKGSGSVYCSFCDYGREDCSCEDGYVYVYEDGK